MCCSHREDGEQEQSCKDIDEALPQSASAAAPMNVVVVATMRAVVREVRIHVSALRDDGDGEALATSR